VTDVLAARSSVTLVGLSRIGERNRSAAERVLRALPQWFELEEPILEYIAEAALLPTFIASSGGEDVGFLTLKPYAATAAEISAMGVLPELHRQGYGRALVAAAEARSREEHRSVIQVKTLGPSHPDANYARTRGFYEALGFIPIDETTAFWGDENPCLVMVKSL
jgi:GNAT superfamily N-acetyltransferase